MKRLNSILTIIILILTISVSAQKVSKIPNILNIKSIRQSGVILEDDKLVGYFVFYFNEKTDKYKNTYEVQLFDDNYSPLKQFEIIRAKNVYLLEVDFNGQVFMLSFYDRKTGYEFVSYKLTGQEVGSHKIIEDDIPYFETLRVRNKIENGIDNNSIFSLGKTGFIRETRTANKKMGYEIISYNNKSEVQWVVGSDKTSDFVESAEITDVSANIISLHVTKRKTISSNRFNTYSILIDRKTGAIINELSMGSDEQGKKSLLKTFVDEKTNTVLLLGEYYLPNDDVLTDKSQGLYIQELSATGEVLNVHEYAWEGYIDQFKQENLDEEDKKEAEKQFYVYFHDVIRTENGKLYFIGEQYRKKLSAIGLLVPSDVKVASVEILLANMMVIEFDQEYKMTDFDLIHKKKNPVLLPSGAEFESAWSLAKYISSIGKFDYSFTSYDEEINKYYIVYADANRKVSESSDNSDGMIGVIQIDNDGHSHSRVPIDIKTLIWWIQPAKPGYIGICEYSIKDREIEYRLEPIEY